VKILFDECVPRTLKRSLSGHFVRTAQQAGFAGFKNGHLIAAAEEEFDLLITTDKNLRYQQNLKTRTIAILLLPTNNSKRIVTITENILAAIHKIKPSQFIELTL
jgi:predicted nuclease of predicted toxin-antitoxin system